MAGLLSPSRSRRRLSPKALLISLAAAAVVVLLGSLLHVRLLMDVQSDMISAQERAVREQKYVLRHELDNVAESAATLAEIARGSLRLSGGGDLAEPSSALRVEFLNFARTRGGFDQIRMIDQSGREVVNIKRERARSGTYHFRDSSPESPKDLGEAKWLSDLLALSPGGLFVSGLEWKTDSVGEAVNPALPLLRVGAALPSEKGRLPEGYVLLDYPAERIFQRLEENDQHLKSGTSIVDSRGDWVREGKPRAKENLTEDSSESAPENLALTNPRAWVEISRNSTGAMMDAPGIVVFDTVSLQPGRPLDGAGEPLQWKILNWLSPSQIAARKQEATFPVWWWVLLAVGLVMPATYLMVNDRELKREASRLKEQARALLQSIADTSADGIVAGEAVRNPRGDIADFRTVFSNPASAEILKKFSDEEADVARRFPLFFSPDFFAQCVQVVVTGSRFETEQNAECVTGRRWFRIVVVKLADGIVLTFSDVTRQKLAVHELRQAKESAEVANRTKTQFLTLMGHEIRTPMNGLLGFASLLEKTELNVEQKDYVSTLRLSGEALLRILDDILNYSHMEHESLQVQLRPVKVRELVTQVNQLFVMALGDRKLELVTRIAPEVPHEIMSDDGRLRQILVNLVGNALKFTEEGFLLIKVLIVEEAQGDLIEFHVIDSGLGVSAEMIDRIFKPFSQVDSTFSRRFGGTGLGLSVCKRLVETMGGKIGVNTAPGKGSDFYFSLPLRTMDFSAAEMPARACLPPSGAPYRILVVDDDAVNRKLIRRMLEKIGAEVELAESGAAAVEWYLSSSFDLIFMDIQMPGMDGLETTMKIRALEAESGTGQRIAISALTANAGEENRLECLASGMDNFLTKPVTMADLEAFLAQLTASTVA